MFWWTNNICVSSKSLLRARDQFPESYCSNNEAMKPPHWDLFTINIT